MNKATDQKRRETPMIRPDIVGIRRDPKWLGSNACYLTSYSAKAQPEGELRATALSPLFVMGAFLYASDKEVNPHGNYRFEITKAGCEGAFAR